MTLAVRDPLAELGVSRETVFLLEKFQSLVRQWTPAINLVSRSTVPVLWQRHILDSAQLFRLAPPNARHWADLGSGAGFPGLVIAIIARELRPEMSVSLIEADARKATFLREAARMLDLTSAVVHGRIETSPPQHADVLSARALCALGGLLALAEMHLAPHGVAIFPKGERREDELREARKVWDFDFDSIPSSSNEQAAILVIRNILRANPR